MIQWLISERFCQSVGILLEHGYLTKGELIAAWVICRSKMRIHRLYSDIWTGPEEVKQFGQFIVHESKTVHSGVKLDMDREVIHSPVFQHFTQNLE